MKTLFAVSLWFQAIWFVAVLGTERLQWLALTMMLAALMFSLRHFSYPLERVIALTMVGIVIDALNQYFGLLRFATNDFPIWLMVLWGAFSWYASHLVVLMKRYPSKLICLMVGVLGSLSYWAAERLGAVHFDWPLGLTMAILWLQWMMIGALILRVFSDDVSKEK